MQEVLRFGANDKAIKLKGGEIKRPITNKLRELSRQSQ